MHLKEFDVTALPHKEQEQSPSCLFYVKREKNPAPCRRSGCHSACCNGPASSSRIFFVFFIMVGTILPQRNEMFSWLYRGGRGEVEETFWAFLLISLLRWHNRPPYAGVYSSPDTLVGQFDPGRLTNKVHKVYRMGFVARPF